MATPPSSQLHSAISSPIWSSRSPSPASSPKSSFDTYASSSSHSAASAPSMSEAPAFTIPRGIEGSEQPLLARTHYTNGYRAGISTGTDDPEIVQGGFDEGFPIGAALAMRVGFLMEGVREVCRVRSDEETGRGRLEEARRELELEALLREMQTDKGLDFGQTRGCPGGEDDGSDVQRDTEPRMLVASLPSVMKWTKFVEAAGVSAVPG